MVVNNYPKIRQNIKSKYEVVVNNYPKECNVSSIFIEITVFGETKFKFWLSLKKNLSFAQDGKGFGICNVQQHYIYAKYLIHFLSSFFVYGDCDVLITGLTIFCIDYAEMLWECMYHSQHASFIISDDVDVQDQQNVIYTKK